MPNKTPSGPRTAVLVGPYLSGKTSLLESMLSISGAIGRKGTAKESNMVGDGSPEGKARQMSTELNIASADYLGESWTFLDCPGSVELGQDAQHALMVADTAVVVCEADPEKAMTVAPVLNFLDTHDIPHMIFVNKMDVPSHSVKDTLDALQEVSAHPLILREIPIRDGDGITGHVDLVSERAFEWQSDKESKLMEIPDPTKDREESARTELLESLADFDDALLENLLEDVVPSSDEIYASLTKDLQESLIVPVFFGSAEHDNGVRRLMKALRHEAPEAAGVAERLGLDGESDTVAQVFKTVHAGHVGKLSIIRVFSGQVKDGMTLNGSRISGMHRIIGQKHEKVGSAAVGEVVALGRMEEISDGTVLSESGSLSVEWPTPLKPLFALSIHAEHRADDVKLSGVLNKLSEEDPSLSWQHHPDTGEMLLWGQGEIHLLIAIDKLKSRFNLEVNSTRPRVPYKETIRKPISQHSRHKKQSGGHGEFGDVHLDIKPLPRGSGFEFSDTITGGAVPKNYIPAVENGVKEFMVRGPLGFQMVDFSVTLTDGQFHAVDSSDMAFKKAAAQAMREGTPNCNPVLLEPIFQVVMSLPSSYTSGVQRLVSGRRGQILGYDAKDGWSGWDEVTIQLPQSEMHDLIIELRSMTLGVGTFDGTFDHLQELSGKEADKVIAERKEALS
jgi:elongation factor G